MKLQQIMRLIIGIFVLGSALLGYFVSKNWLFFTMFVGLNLMQFAFTKWCLLENVLLKLGAEK